MAETDHPRSVLDEAESTRSVQMTLVGLVVAVGAALVLLPLAPFIAAFWLVADHPTPLGGGE
jgi:hypothetical protein